MEEEESDRRIRSVVIVGGGTAGWLSAAYLNRALGPRTRVTLIESTQVGRIGVGEATIPTLRWTFAFLGLEEREWMPACNATYKMAIRFDGWTFDGDIPSRFYHPFSSRNEKRINPVGSPYFPEIGEGVSRAHHWWRMKRRGKLHEPYASACYPAPALCDALRSPRSEMNPELDQPYAYHFDATLLAEYLCTLAKGRGVEQVFGHVQEVQREEDGRISRLLTDDGRVIEGDLFVDCSGFIGLLINKTLGVPFESDIDVLSCDSAVAVGANHGASNGIRPYTISTAAEHGWIWDVPLFNRRGCGYVYSSNHCSPDAAERQLRAYLGDQVLPTEARHLRMRVGQNREVFSHNCVAIGLSACFLEPLESTGIFLIEYQLAMLVMLLPDRSFPLPLVAKYNQVIRRRYEDTRDFIVMHYMLSNRPEPFWVDARKSARQPSSLREQFELLEVCFPVLDRLEFPIFRDMNYVSILAGMGFEPELDHPLLAHIGDEHGDALLREAFELRDRLLEALPDHHAYLERMYAAGTTGARTIRER